MLFPLYLSSTRLFSFPPTIYLSSFTVPLFSFLTSSSFPLLHSPPTLSLISLDPAPPSLSFSIFFSSYSYSTLPLTSLMSTVYFHHLASSLRPLPPPPLVYCPPRSTLLGGKRREERRWRGRKKRRPFVYVLQVSRIYVFCIWYFSPRAPNASEGTMPFWYFRFSLASLRVTPTSI